MRILIIDNTMDLDSWGSPELVRCARLAVGARIDVRRAPQEDLPESLEPYDRIIVSGSKTSATEDAPWIGRLEQFTRKAIDAGKPYLGVCYGHQILARSLGGKASVRKAAVPELGWTRIERTEEGRLMQGMPDTFYSFSSHYDEVSQLPSGAKLLARSKSCAVQGFELEGKAVFGIQFHPEKNLEDTEKFFASHKKKKTRNLLLPDQGPKLYDPKVAEKIFLNFFQL